MCALAAELQTPSVSKESEPEEAGRQTLSANVWCPCIKKKKVGERKVVTFGKLLNSVEIYQSQTYSEAVLR